MMSTPVEIDGALVSFDPLLLKGDPGSPGSQGAPGAVGATTNLTMGTITTVPAGQSGSASLTGTPPNQVLNLVLPAGPAGSGSTTATLTSAWNLAGNGVTDDGAALALMYAAATTTSVQFERGKTYKFGSSITMTKDTDLNGATLNITGRLNFSGSKLFNGTVQVTDKINLQSLSDTFLDELTVINPSAGANGIYALNCNRLRITRCKVSGGFRGITIDQSDNFVVDDNDVSNVSAAGAYGILVAGATGTAHGVGRVSNNRVTDCMFGIAAYGGEANPANSGYATDYTLSDILITGNHVLVTTPDTLIGCIYATRATGITVSNNIVRGGFDVGIDFEYCTLSAAIGNDVTDMTNGALSAIFGSTDILFEDNRVSYVRTKTGTVSGSGSEHANTSNLIVLLRDTPKRITFKNNKFRVTNTTLGWGNLGSASQSITFADNEFHNCYLSGANTVGGNVTDMMIIDNRFGFDILVGGSVIYHERVLRWHCRRNRIRTISGEAAPDFGKFICIYDAVGSGTGNSDFVYITGNHVDDQGANNGIGLISGSSTLNAYIADNESDRITAMVIAGSWSNWIFMGNVAVSAPGNTVLTSHSDSSVKIPATSMGWPGFTARSLQLTSTEFFSSDGTGVMRIDNSRNFTFGSIIPSYGGGVGVILIDNATTPPATAPTGGVLLYADSGVLKVKNAAGTVTTLG